MGCGSRRPAGRSGLGAGQGTTGTPEAPPAATPLPVLGRRGTGRLDAPRGELGPELLLVPLHLVATGPHRLADPVPRALGHLAGRPAHFHHQRIRLQPGRGLLHGAPDLALRPQRRSGADGHPGDQPESPFGHELTTAVSVPERVVRTAAAVAAVAAV